MVTLDEVYETVREDARWDHLRTPGIVLVPGRGQTDPELCRVMIVGEAPGATENTKRRPFCGPSGRVLDQLMGLAGLRAYWARESHPGGLAGETREIVANAFITNVVKYRPPGNRTPTAQETIWGTEALRREWAALGRPSVLVAVGAVARAALVPKQRGTIAPGNMVDLSTSMRDAYVWVQYHPAWAIRQNTDAARRTLERHWEEMGKWLSARQMI